MNLRQMYDRKMGQIVESDNARRSLEAFVKQDKAISGSMNSDERVRTMRRQREQGEREAETKIEQSMEYQKQLAEQRLMQKEDEAIAAALQRQDLQRQREELEIRRIREQSTELRDLEQKLRAAYLTKERNKQMEDKRASEVRKLQEQRLLDIEMEADRLKKLKADEDKRASLVAQAYEKKRVLDIQMDEQRNAKQQVCVLLLLLLLLLLLAAASSNQQRGNTCVRHTKSSRGRRGWLTVLSRRSWRRSGWSRWTR
jgi:hypothetical protein